MNVTLGDDGALACPDCGWTTSPDAAYPRRSLGSHIAKAHGDYLIDDSPNVLRGGRWAPGPRGVRVWVPDERTAP